MKMPITSVSAVGLVGGFLPESYRFRVWLVALADPAAAGFRRTRRTLAASTE